ncbi:polymorphic toxin-type HINT domain-containing protein [Streptomyces sp. NRRL S-237]|uniref:polymorphic toxin-type HINT domain-containing protein n=1 Tax=Streptomyces sp. NRRL S-237 TaxID=1463895 RepID=UPI00099CAF28|nr:polymorphic toxin-type HINT domain-containing protein [Streptomyces sp. NRRL S-237]
MAISVAVTVLGTFTGEAAAATAVRDQKASVTRTVQSLDQLVAGLKPKTAGTPAPAPRSELDRISAERDRQLVEDFAEFDAEEEVREAAKKALESTDPNAVRDFLQHGEAEARQRAKDKRAGTDVANRARIEKLRGTGGTFFNAEVERVLKGTPQDRADFLAFGAEIAKQRDEAEKQNAAKRAEENRKRVEMLAAVGGPAVKRAAQAALDSKNDAVIAEFLEKGYQAAAQQDADDRAAHEKAQKEAQEAADKLRELARRTTAAAEARTKLIAAHGEAVKALKNASNAMSSAASTAREADRMLAADRAGKRLSNYDPVKTEVKRQVGYAQDAAKAAQVAAAQAKVQADVLVQNGLEHGTQWAEVAAGIATAADAAAKAGQTAQHAVDATAATAAGLNAKDQAELHEQQAKKWRANAEEHARAAARLAEAADKQAKIAATAATRAKDARVAAEQAEREAWEHARKTRDARLEAERQAQIAAEQRKIAERERDLAAAARARAERERDIAAAARARAEAEARTASAARAQAQAAAATAASARASAEKQDGIAAEADRKAGAEETNARNARNAARTAEQRHQAQEARARATEALAASGRGTVHAAEARAAADAARADANTAGTAAGQARTAADTASGAAVRSRAAATEAAGAAARARAAAAEATAHAARANAAANKAEAAASAAGAAANRAEAQAALTHAAALRANQKAAEATAQEARAGIAAHEAARLAGLAAMAANNSLQAANRTKEEAEGAVREAAMARVQAGIAVKASASARSSAAGIAEPANTAIALTAPFVGKDVDADFAAEVAAAALDLGAEQVASAEAKAAEAVKAAEAAEAAAKRANAQVAPAFQAAADAARSSANAARSAAAAMKSAAQAAEEGAKARAAAARANQADAQAQADAKLARTAANKAYADATAARNAAVQAEAEASRARGAAAEADNHAAAANSAASLAEQEASVAQGAAAQAEKDAADANKFAESAEGHAKSAEAAAKNANTYAKEADEAAKKAEEYEREQQRKARERAAKEVKEKGNYPNLNEEEIAALKAAGISPEEYEKARQLANKDFLDFLVENGGQIIVDLLFEDIKNCITEGDFESCFWAVVGALPWGKALKLIKEMPAITKAVSRIVTGLDDFLDASATAKKLIAKGEEALEKFRRIPACMPGSKAPNSFAPGTPVLMADGTQKPIQDVRVGEQVLATDPETGRTEGHAVTDLIIGEGQKSLRELTVDTDGAAGNATGTITATAGHPFWVENRHAWVGAAGLKAGDRLRSSEGELKELVGVRAWTEPMRVHNLTVDVLHTYYVVTAGASVLVHNSTCPTNFKSLGGNRFESPAGLVYEPGSAHGHRIDHVMEHAVPDPSKPTHSVFSNPDMGDIMGLIDEGWLKRGTADPSDPAKYVVDMGKTIGTLGEKKLKIVVVPGTNRVITAHPML